MVLTLGQWAAVATVIAAHTPNPALIAAVENELRKAREMHIPESGNGTETGKMADVTTGQEAVLETLSIPLALATQRTVKGVRND